MSDLSQDTGEEGDESESEVQIVAEIKNKPASAGVLVLPQEVQSQLRKFMRNVEGTSKTPSHSALLPMSTSTRVGRNAASEYYDSVDPATSRMRQRQQQQAIPFVEKSDDMQMQVMVEDVMKYLDKIKLRYKFRPEVYESFLEIIRDFKALRIKVSCVIKRVVELFKGNEDLILEFNLFLPQGSKITSDGSIIQH